MTIGSWITRRQRHWERRLARLAAYLTSRESDQPGDNPGPTQEKKQ